MSGPTRETDAWYKDAACLGTATGLWYTTEAEAQREALAICAACPVIYECLNAARAEEAQVGQVWGTRAGMTMQQRRDALAAGDPRCGTEAGYRAHMREKTTSCKPCRAAARQADKARARWRAILAIPITEMGAAPRDLVDPEIAHVEITRCPACGAWSCDADVIHRCPLRGQWTTSRVRSLHGQAEEGAA